MATSKAIAAIQAGDAERLRTLLADDASAAVARDANGISPIMYALYQRRQDMIPLLLATLPTLDIFEAASLGQCERVAELLAAIRRWCTVGPAMALPRYTSPVFSARKRSLICFCERAPILLPYPATQCK